MKTFDHLSPLHLTKRINNKLFYAWLHVDREKRSEHTQRFALIK